MKKYCILNDCVVEVPPNPDAWCNAKVFYGSWLGAMKALHFQRKMERLKCAKN